MINRPIQFIFAFLSLFFLVVSCEKDTADVNGVTYPSVVTARSLETRGAVRMFTKDGEVTDEASIARFIAGGGIHEPNIFEESFESHPDSKITFHSKDSLTFADEILKFGITETQEGKFMISRDFRSEVITQPPYIMSVIEDLWRMGIHRSPLEKILQSNGFFFTGKEYRVGYGSFKSFKLPVLLFKLKRQSSVEESKSMRMNLGNRFDEFDEDFISTLANEDTLAIQQHYVLFE